MLIMAKDNKVLLPTHQQTATGHVLLIPSAMEYPYGNVYDIGSVLGGMVDSYIKQPREQRTKLAFRGRIAAVIDSSKTLWTIAQSVNVIDACVKLGDGCQVAMSADPDYLDAAMTALEISDSLEEAFGLVCKRFRMMPEYYQIVDLDDLVAKMVESGRTDSVLSYIAG